MIKLAEVVHKEGLKKMSVQERQGIEDQLNNLKSQLADKPEDRDGQKARPDLLQDKPKILAQKKKLEELLNKDDDLVLKGAERDQAVKRLKEICPELKKHMLTERQEKQTPKNLADYENAVNQQMYVQTNFQKVIEEICELGRRLEPLDPQAGNLKALLKKYG